MAQERGDILFLEDDLVLAPDHRLLLRFMVTAKTHPEAFPVEIAALLRCASVRDALC